MLIVGIVLLVLVLPIVVYLLNGVLQAAKGIVPTVDRIAATAEAGSKDLDAVPLLLTTQDQVKQTWREQKRFTPTVERGWVKDHLARWDAAVAKA